VTVTLAPKEIEVVRLVCEGRTNRQIATALGKSTETVKHQIHVAMDKTCTSNRVDLAMYAVRNRLFNPYRMPERGEMLASLRQL
jgi:DNA-binding NarL/FixJ family response regulator